MRDQGGQGDSQAILKTKEVQQNNNQNKVIPPNQSTTPIPIILRKLQRPQTESPNIVGDVTQKRQDQEENKQEKAALKQQTPEGPEDKGVQSVENILPSVRIEGMRDNRTLVIGEHPILQILQEDNTRRSEQIFQTTSIDESKTEDVQIHPTIHNNSRHKKPIAKVDINSSTLGNQTHNDDSEGWTLVTRRKKNSSSQARPHGKTQQTPLQLHAKKLRQQQGCFRCLMKGHIQLVCKNQRRCLHCNIEGHII